MLLVRKLNFSNMIGRCVTHKYTLFLAVEGKDESQTQLVPLLEHRNGVMGGWQTELLVISVTETKWLLEKACAQRYGVPAW